MYDKREIDTSFVENINIIETDAHELEFKDMAQPLKIADCLYMTLSERNGSELCI